MLGPRNVKKKKRLKGQFLFPLNTAEIISFWTQKHTSRFFSSVHEDVILWRQDKQETNFLLWEV